MNNQTRKVLILGGGIAGLTAAWELSRQNISVELVEKSCFLGGHSIGFTCKATDKCQQCGACSVEDMLKNVVNEPLINVHLRTEIKEVQKYNKNNSDENTGTDTDGNTGIDTDGNTGIDKLKNTEIHEFSITLAKTEITIPVGETIKGFSKHNNPLYVTDSDKDKMGSEGKINVAAVIVATGYSPFDPNRKSTYGYGKWKNVITGLDLENIIRDNGALVRPSDGKKPEKVAFIQCVGSRDERLGNLWCSEVCCPYAMRMAGTVKHDNPNAQITMFYIDIQNTAKEFPIFYEKIKQNIRFVRTIPVDIYPLENDGLELRHMAEEEGSPSSESFDLVVLSVGIMPGKDSVQISEITGFPINQDGFLDNTIACCSCDSSVNDSSSGLSVNDSSSGSSTQSCLCGSLVQPCSGYFVTGTAKGPASIAATMADAGKTAFEAMKYLGVMK